MGNNNNFTELALDFLNSTGDLEENVTEFLIDVCNKSTSSRENLFDFLNSTSNLLFDREIDLSS